MRHGLIALAILASGLIATSALAACVQADFAGRYRLLGSWSDNAKPSGLLSCVVEIEPDGTVAAGSGCTDRDADSAIERFQVTGGRIKGGESCRFTGTIRFADDGGFWTARINKGFLNKDRDVIAGIANTGDGEPYTFAGRRKNSE